MFIISAMLAWTNSSTIKISNTSEQIVKNGNPDRSNMNHDTVATIMTPKETCHHFQSSTSAAIKEREQEISKISRTTANTENDEMKSYTVVVAAIISYNLAYIMTNSNKFSL